MKTPTPPANGVRVGVREAPRLAKDALPAGTAARSRKDSTSHQPFAVLALKTSFNTDYRGVAQLLTDLRKDLGREPATAAAQRLGSLAPGAVSFFSPDGADARAVHAQPLGVVPQGGRDPRPDAVTAPPVVPLPQPVGPPVAGRPHAMPVLAKYRLELLAYGLLMLVPYAVLVAVTATR